MQNAIPNWWSKPPFSSLYLLHFQRALHQPLLSSFGESAPCHLTRRGIPGNLMSKWICLSLWWVICPNSPSSPGEVPACWLQHAHRERGTEQCPWHSCACAPVSAAGQDVIRKHISFSNLQDRGDGSRLVIGLYFKKKENQMHDLIVRSKTCAHSPLAFHSQRSPFRWEAVHTDGVFFLFPSICARSQFITIMFEWYLFWYYLCRESAHIRAGKSTDLNLQRRELQSLSWQRWSFLGSRSKQMVGGRTIISDSSGRCFPLGKLIAEILG